MAILVGFNSFFHHDHKKDGWKITIDRINICLLGLLYLFIHLVNSTNEKNKNYNPNSLSFSSTFVALSFFKLPINTITSATIMEQTNNTVSLTSSEEQSLILLPKPQIEIKEANFSVQNDLLSADLITKNVMFSRSLLDSNNISISIPNASIGNLNINALENEVLLEGEIENLDLNISSNENTY